MTPKQSERLRNKITAVKRTLAAEKRKFGGYDDGRGLRYLSTKYYIQLGEYKQGLAYTKWFAKTFPNDGGFPDLLFEWTIILFKTGQLKEAEKKVFETFCSNTYLFDKFLGRPITPIEKWEDSNVAVPEFTEYLAYSSNQTELADFAEWLSQYTSTNNFIDISNRYVEIYKKLKLEQDRKTRHYLLMQASQLVAD